MADAADGAGKGLLKRLAELLSLLTAAAFLVSAIINSAIFYGWGVTFLAIATPTDVVMSGLQLLIYALMLMAYVALLSVALLPEQDAGPWRRKLKTWFVRGGAVAVLIPVLVIGAAARFDHDLGLPPAQQMLIVASCVLTFVALLIVADISSQEPVRDAFGIMRDHIRGTRPIGSLTGSNGLLFGSMFFVSGTVLLATAVSLTGFVPRGTWYDGPGDNGCPPLHVLWIGQSTLLVQCPVGGEVRVLARAGGGVMRVNERRPAPLAR